MNIFAKTGACRTGVVVLVAAGLCGVADTAGAAGDVIYLTAEYGKTTFGGGSSSYDALAVERLADAGLDATLGESSLDNHYSLRKFRSFGMRLQNAYSAVEVSYFNLGKASYAATGQADDGSGPADLSTALAVNSHGPALSLIGVLGTTWQLQGRGGIYYGKTGTVWSATIDGVDTGVYSDRKRKISPLLGAALIRDIGAQWALSLGYTRFFDVANHSVDRLSLGVSLVLRDP